MRVRTTVLGLLLLLVQFAYAHRTNNDNRYEGREVRLRRHDHEERSSGRRWTTSRNSPYQKVVSRYDQEQDGRSAERLESETPEESKAKSAKRKMWRTDTTSRDQMPSETASIVESELDEQTSESADQSPEALRKSSGTSRRRSTTSQPRDTSPNGYLEVITSNPKKRRRIQTTSTSTTTHAPQTMSDTLYQHFQPLDHNVPQDDIIPFLDFGRKLSPVLPTPSGANSIDNRSTAMRTRMRTHHEEKESQASDEEMLQEDMDVTVVKKAIERNSVPRAKLRVREQGISDYYRKRVPVQVRTTENLISSSDSSTVSSVTGTKNNAVLRKINRHQINNDQLIKYPEHITDKLIQNVESHLLPSNVELLEEKVTEILSKHSEKSAALTEESHHSPLTAESSVVKTVIKEIPSTEKSVELQLTPSTLRNVTSLKNVTENVPRVQSPQDKFPSTKTNKTSNLTEENLNPKIISTAVVTSVSIQESLLKPQTQFVSERPATVIIANTTTEISPVTLIRTVDAELTTNYSDDTTSTELLSRNYISSKNTTNAVSTVSSALVPNATSIEPKATLLRNETSLRSRDIYKPKAIPPGINIHHLPRQITFNLTRKTNSSSYSATNGFSNLTTSHSTTTSSTTTTIKVPSSSITTFPSFTQRISTQWRPTTSPKFHTARASTPKEVTERVLDEKSAGTSSTTHSPPIETIPIDAQESNSTDDVRPPEISSNSSQSIEDVMSEETESVPPPKYEESVENLTFVPAPSEEDSEDQFPIYFTTLPTAAPPVVVDTRPASVRNVTTARPGADWVRVGAVDKEVEVVYPEPLGVGAYLLAGLGVVPIILGALIGARFILAHNKKKVLDESEYSSEYNRSPLGASTASPLPTKLPRVNTHMSWNETENKAPVIAPVPVTSSVARWEFSRDKMRLQTLLGQGNFGQVWKAEADDISGHEGLTRLVAVKTVKESANTREREDLLRELGIMQELGSHPNVVTLLGCCTEKEPIYLIMEYVMYGKLLSFLRDHRTRAHYYNFSDATDALTSRDLTVFGYCVARGMDYLTNKSIIHRDLAARNVLVDHNKLCKIADFGMSRNVRDTGQIYEQRQSKGALPIRWMAPESLHFSLFTHKTDVWSFGILMWEIVTLGSTPYATMGAREVMRRVGDGYRLERPTHCRPELFRLISQCWHSEPSRRPTFAELKVELGHLLNDAERGGGFVDLESFADEMRRDSLHRHH